jgi:S-adenosylmethionine:tRNA ribosyltransferase-isomerase
MKTKELDYYIPSQLIAQQPACVRTQSRLLVLDRSKGRLIDARFDKLGDLLAPGDCLVLNDTKVLLARFFAHKTTGAKLEGLFLAEIEPNLWQVRLKGARKIATGQNLTLSSRDKADYCTAQVAEKSQDGKCLLKLQTSDGLETVLDKIGFPPLPPYIKRGDNPAQADTDATRYQTVYARNTGAVAAPTAGLHFTHELIDRLRNRGIRFAFITLHVGLGTFKPVTAEDLEKHKMHQEQFSIDRENAALINDAKAAGGRIVAVGTTSVRVLETVASASGLQAQQGKTHLFITPGYEFKAVDAMVTNFHLPRSTLLALVAAFCGLENILTAYRHAVERRYRFYSYGDAMLIL